MPVRRPSPESVRLLGIDPGTQVAGWGIVEARGPALSLVACGALRAPRRGAMPDRLRAIFEELEEILSARCPRAAALEETFAGRNAKAVIAMGQGRGVAMLACARAGVPLIELSASEIKKAVTGNGAATKPQVARMVCARLSLAQAPAPEDVTDALAAAIALAHRLPASI